MSEQTHHARHAQESSMVSGIPSLGTANSPDSHSRASCFHDIPLLSLHELAADDRTCNICYAAYVSERVADDNSEGEHPLQLPCKHVFGHNCLKLWLAENDTCPLCRRVLFLRDARRDLGDHADEAHTGPSFTDETDFPSIEVQLLFSTEFIRIIQNDQLLRAHDERHAHDRARAMQNFYVYNLYARLPPPGLLSSLHEGQISTPFQNFVEYFRSQFSEEMLTMTHEYQLFEYLCWKGAFRGRGFDLIREARSFSDLELYCELMHLGVKWENEDESIGAWLTPSGAPFLPLGWHGPLTMALA